MRKFLIGSVAASLLLVSVGWGQTAGSGDSEQQHRSLDTQIQRSNARIAAWQSQSNTLGSDFANLNAKAKRVVDESSNLEIQEKELQTEVARQAPQEQALKTTKATLDSRANRLRDDSANLKSAQGNLHRELAAINSERQRLNHANRYEVNRFNARVNAYNSSLRDLKQRVASLNAVARQLNWDSQSYNSRLEALNRVRRALREQWQRLRDASARNHADALAVRREGQTLVGRRDALNLEQHRLRDDQQTLARDVQTYNTQVPGVTSRITYDTTGQWNDPHAKSGSSGFGNLHDTLGRSRKDAAQAVHEKQLLDKQFQK